MTKFYDVLDKIKTKLIAEPFCNTVSYGSLDDVDLNKQNIFPLSHIIVNNPELFEEGNEGNEHGSTQNFARKWGWYSSIYGLTKGDVSKYDSITKLNVHQCLMFLAFEKEKVQLERQQIKSKQR
jgi:hypothetical protein